LSDKFWIYANGDSCFASWLRQVNDLTWRFIETELLSLPELHEFDARDAFDNGVRPVDYFMTVLTEIRCANGEDLVDGYVARVIKYGGETI
jgi:hypothetical protein